MVDESWPTHGVPSSFYSRHKAEGRGTARRVRGRAPRTRRCPAASCADLSKGGRDWDPAPLPRAAFPGTLARESVIPVVPELDRLRFQAVHGADVAEAYRLALRRDARGPFNIAADPVLDASTLAELLDARPVRVPAAALRGAASITWRMRAQPSPPGWVDMALAVPLLDAARAREELGWRPASAARTRCASCSRACVRGGVPDSPARSRHQRPASRPGVSDGDRRDFALDQAPADVHLAAWGRLAAGRARQAPAIAIAVGSAAPRPRTPGCAAAGRSARKRRG